jgi:hypothetical protein
MSNDRFEDRLEALFDRPPAMEGHSAFAIGVQRRLASRARRRSDAVAAAWIVSGAALLWGLAASLDAAGVSAQLAQWSVQLGVDPDLGGLWLLPVLAIGGVLLFQAFEDNWVRD